MIFAARLMQDASPTDVPPNFITCNRFFISLFCECGKTNPTVVEAPLSLPPLHTLYRSGLGAFRRRFDENDLYSPAMPSHLDRKASKTVWNFRFWLDRDHPPEAQHAGTLGLLHPESIREPSGCEKECPVAKLREKALGLSSLRAASDRGESASDKRDQRDTAPEGKWCSGIGSGWVSPNVAD